jgi:hypothetical protein
MRLHFFFIRYHQWLTVACQFFEHLESDSDKVFVVSTRTTVARVLPAGTVPADRCIEISQIREVLAAHPDAEIELYLQLSDGGLTEFHKWLYPALTNSQRGIRLSFYPDGYTNKIYGLTQLPTLVADHPDISFGYIYQFDVASDVPDLSALGLTVRLISSESIVRFNTSATVSAIAEAEIAGCIDGGCADDVLLLLMRPWGSETFLKGRLRFESAPELFATILASLIARIQIDLGRELTVLVRPDGRDAALSAASASVLSDLIAGGAVPSVQMKMVSANWPAWLTFDPFIFNFNRCAPGRRLHVAGLDSTASLPFLTTRRGSTHYFGVPSGAVPADVTDRTAFQSIEGKLRHMRRFIKAIPKDAIEFVDFEPFFFKAVLREPGN